MRIVGPREIAMVIAALLALAGILTMLMRCPGQRVGPPTSEAKQRQWHHPRH